MRVRPIPEWQEQVVSYIKPPDAPMRLLTQRTTVLPPTTSGEEDSRYKAPALSKGLDILELLATHGQAFALAEIAAHLERSTSEIYRMLHVLRQRGYVELGRDDRYSLTTRLFEIAHRHPPIRRLTAITGDAMQRLANEINQSIHLAILHSGKILVVSQVDCPGDTISTVRLGAQFPIYNSASGRALAAFMNEEELEFLLSLAGDAPEQDRKTFLADLETVRKIGYCQGTSLLIEGVINLSVPIFDYTGNVIAAITTPFIHRLAGTETLGVDEARMALVRTGEELSQRMGARAAT